MLGLPSTLQDRPVLLTTFYKRLPQRAVSCFIAQQSFDQDTRVCGLQVMLHTGFQITQPYGLLGFFRSYFHQCFSQVCDIHLKIKMRSQTELKIKINLDSSNHTLQAHFNHWTFLLPR